MSHYYVNNYIILNMGKVLLLLVPTDHGTTD